MKQVKPRVRARLWNLIGVVSVVVAGSSSLFAVNPSASYIFPAGAQRGTTVQIRVGGLNLYQGCNFRMTGPGIEASDHVHAVETVRFPRQFAPQAYFPQESAFPRDYTGTIQVEAESRLGMRYWHVRTSQGGTPPRRFMIGDLPEVVEAEIDGDAIPQAVQLPVTTNGRIYPREDVDIWSFDARAGQEVTCEVHAARLGSTLESFLEVRDGNDRRIAENTDHFGSDSFLRFIAPDNDTYFVHIRDIRLGGMQSSIYRLTISDGPYIDTTYPLGGRRGELVSLELLGQSTSAERVEFVLPADGPADYTHELLCGGTSQVVQLDLSDFPEVLESEPNHDPPQVPALQAPVVLNGRIAEPGDEDCWQLTAKKGETVQLEFRARRPGALLNPLLVISDDTGKVLHRTEDRNQFSFPEDGTYCLRIKERFKPRGGQQFVYRMQIGPPPKPDFRLSTGSQALTLVRGASIELDVNTQREGGFNGEIKLTVEDLPPEVTASEPAIPEGKNTIKVKLTAGENTRVAGTQIRIRGSAEIDGEMVTRTVTSQLDPGEPPMETLLLATSLSAPFKFAGDYEIPFALRGTTHYRRYHLDRGGFAGQIYAMPADTQVRYQWGTRGSTVAIPPEVTEFDFPLQVSTWTKVGLTGRTVIMLVGEVEDFDGSRHTVAWSSVTAKDQVMIQPSAGPLALEVLNSSVVASVEKPAQVPVRILRDTDLPLPVTLTLVTGEHMRGIEATPVEIPADAERGSLGIRFTADAGPFNMPLVIRATARPPKTMIVRGRPLRTNDPVIAETSIEVVIP